MTDLLEELDLLAPARPGRPPLSAEYTRDLTRADVAALSQYREVRAPAPTLRRIHSSHHALAKCLATGMSGRDASLITGYTQGRISVLSGDPTFKELVESYRAEAKGVVADITERMSNISLDALELIQEQLNDKAETLSVPVLLDIVKAFADRTGHGPNQEVVLKVTPTDLIDRPPRETHEEWKERRRRELEGNVVRLVTGPPGESA